MPQQRLRKFSRDPNYLARSRKRQLTPQPLDIIPTIQRYQLIPTSLILRLVAGDRRNAYDHLHHLYHRRLVNRFCFFGPTGRAAEFNYFLDNPQTLDLLIDAGRGDPDALDFDQVKRNREKWTPLVGM